MNDDTDRPPKLEAPELDAPELEAPELEAPELEAPELEAPELDAATLDAIDATVPAVDGDGRVLLMGGSFNPPHLAHALLAIAALSSEDIDTLWVLPCADHPFGKALAPFEHRMEMCERAFERVSTTHIVDVEKHLPTPSFTVQTLRYLKAVRPALRPAFVVGTDILDELHRWREPDALVELCDLIVIPRAGYPRKGRLEITLPEVSSTEVRRRFLADEDNSGFLASRVLSYVNEHHLYRAPGG